MLTSCKIMLKKIPSASLGPTRKGLIWVTAYMGELSPLFCADTSDVRLSPLPEIGRVNLLVFEISIAVQPSFELFQELLLQLSVQIGVFHLVAELG